MTSHISDELPRLLSGEATREAVLSSAAHLRECEDCRQELVSAVVAHASLTSAQRFAPEIVNALREPAEVTSEAPDNPPALPDLSAVFAQVRREAAAPAQPRRRFSRVAMGAVAAGLVVGAGGVALVDHVGSSSATSGQTVALAAFGVGHEPASVKLVNGDTMRIDARSLPKLASTERYEVWLTNSARTRMQPVGWIAANGKAELTVPPDLMQTFQAIEVSVQPVDAASYDYSGVSVVRGTYRS